ncbi:T-cell receptor alpha chain V region RL-5 [Takifugu flavidus]|nr:T-cell receptor alpha chain V region RL-5 [Takifugu flavidus]
MTPLFVSLWMATLWAECRTQKDTVLQPKAEEMAAEDQTVTLDCHYTSTDTDVYIFWYKQDGTSRPQFILSRFTFGQGKTEDEFKERFSSTLNPTMKSVPLKIQELQLSDSAVYYCALRPTVTGSSRSAH